MARAKTAQRVTDAPRQDDTAGAKIRRRATPQAARQTAPAVDGSRFSRTGWLAGILRERILGGVYRPGERIREVQLREEFGFSNGPIREALQAIVADGLAERAPWHGVRVKALDEQELIDLFQVRLALLEYAAELAARRVSDRVIESAAALKRELDAGFRRIEQADSHPSFNGRLSQWLLAAAGNVALHAVWDKTMLQTLIYVNASLMRSHGRKSRALINRLIDAICESDVAAARTAARELTRQTLVDLGIKGTV
jgi:DNA-binding GntR family transcriptional regulator